MKTLLIVLLCLLSCLFSRSGARNMPSFTSVVLAPSGFEKVQPEELPKEQQAVVHDPGKARKTTAAQDLIEPELLALLLLVMLLAMMYTNPSR